MIPQVRTRRRTAALCVGLAALAACTMSTEASEGTTADPDDEAVAAPLPTIGLGSLGEESAVASGFTANDPDAVESITMIGDSITVASTEQLRAQFGELGFGDVTMVSQQGKRMSESFGDNTSGDRIASYLAAEYDGEPYENLWVVALGTNDVSQYDDPAELQAAVDSIIDAVPDESPLIWIDTYVEQHPIDTAAVNDAIARAIAERGNATIGSWNGVAANDGVMSSDGVHPTDAGEVAFASLVTASTADFLGR